MNIQYYGDYCFKITTKPFGRATEDIVIWTNPCDASVGLRGPQGQPDIVFLSHGNRDVFKTFLQEEKTVILDAPGEYATKGVNAFGIVSYRDQENGALRGQNTIFEFQVESINLCFLGGLGHELSPAQIEKIAAVDILFLPIGGKDTLEVKKLDELIRKIEPKIVIPMHYALPNATIDADDESHFCGEIGNCPSEKVGKLSLKKKDLEGKSMEIVLFDKS